MKIQFLGAAGTVTGSKTLLRVEGKTLLIDCGLFQGLKPLRQRNWNAFPIDPKKIDAVLLTHAHIDHSGYLPKLVKEGFKGRILCTPGTLALCELLLPDSAYLQEEQANFMNQHHCSKHHPAKPLYTVSDANRALNQFEVIDFHLPYSLENTLSLTFYHAGHIIGASSVKIIHENSSIVFSGDLGRFDDPIMKAPEWIQEANAVVIESTYGDRLHNKVAPEAVLMPIIQDTLLQGGTLLIPCFAVGRTQSILFYLSELKEKNLIPADCPIYLDSPMAHSATKIFEQFKGEHRLTAMQLKQIHRHTHFIRDQFDSKAIDQNNSPKIILSASGMLEGGRILHHLLHYGTQKKNAILFTGYQAAGTRGEALLAGKKEIKLFGQMIKIEAKIHQLDMLSAHADQSDLLNWLSHFRQDKLNTIYINHGERHAIESLQKAIQEKLQKNAIPAKETLPL